MASRLPSARMRSSVAATCLASALAPFMTATGRFAGRAADARRSADLLTGLAGDLATFFEAVLAARLGDDINVLSFLHDLVLLQLHLAVRHGFAGLHVVFASVQPV